MEAIGEIRPELHMQQAAFYTATVPLQDHPETNMKREAIVAPFIVRLRGADKLLRGMVLGDVIILNSAAPAHLHESHAQNNARRIKWGLLPSNACRFIHTLSDVGFLPYNSPAAAT